jgi:hypothetical protein
MRIKARLRKTLAIAPVALLVALAACGSGSSSGETTRHTETDPDGLPVAHVAARYATALAADLDTLVASTDTSFVGEVVGTASQRELTFGDTERSVPVTTYLVRVDESNGEPAVGAIVETEQMGGVVKDSQGNDVRVALEFDAPMYTGDRFLFVATDHGDYFTASAFARFPVRNGRIAAPEAWQDLGASRELAGATVAEALELVGSRGH